VVSTSLPRSFDAVEDQIVAPRIQSLVWARDLRVRQHPGRCQSLRLNRSECGNDSLWQIGAAVLLAELEQRIAIEDIAVNDQCRDAAGIPDAGGGVGIENEYVGAPAGGNLT